MLIRLSALGGASALALLTASAASAGLVNTTITQNAVPIIAPGSTGTVSWTLVNAGPGKAPVRYIQFQAPSDTTIASDSYDVNGSPGTIPCTLSTNAETLTCQQTHDFNWLVQSYQLSIQVTMDTSAPLGSTFADGLLTMQGGPDELVNYPSTPVSFAVQTPTVVGVPIASPLVAGPASGAVVAALGVGIWLRRRRMASVG
jgi:hypothetical protein